MTDAVVYKLYSHRPLSTAANQQLAVSTGTIATYFGNLAPPCGCLRTEVHELCVRALLRGHRDNATDIEKDPSSTENHGNFRALLNFRVDAGDNVLGDHLTTASKNATYTSCVIQNQVIDVVAPILHSLLNPPSRISKSATVSARVICSKRRRADISADSDRTQSS